MPSRSKRALIRVRISRSMRQCSPNIQTHPEFGTAMQEARDAGVEILLFSCHVEPDGLTVK